MLKEGYQPNKGKLNIKNPPKGGSGMPNKKNIYKKMWKIFKKKYGEEYIIFEGGDSVKDVMDEFEENYLKDDDI